MSITVTWDDEQRTRLRYDFRERWNLLTFKRALAKGRALTNSVHTRVDIILDMSQSAARSPDSLTDSLHEILPFIPANSGGVVIATGNAPVHGVIAALSRIYKRADHTVFMVGSLQQARHLVQLTRMHQPVAVA